VRTKSVTQLTSDIYVWINAAKHNGKGYSDKQIWRADDKLDGRWEIFNSLICEQELTLEVTGDRYRLTPINTQQLINNN
jgi:hypothetical protein